MIIRCQFLVVITFLFLSCNKNDNQSINICQLIESINQKDQLYRGDPRLEDPFFNILDSIKKSEGITNEEYGNFTEDIQLAYGRKARAIANKLPTVNQKLLDSLMKLQESLDHENTKALINYIKETGNYPTMEITGCNAQPDLVFRHSPSDYFEDIKIIIDEQLEKGNMNDFQYRVYSQHFERATKHRDTLKINNSELKIY